MAGKDIAGMMTAMQGTTPSRSNRKSTVAVGSPKPPPPAPPGKAEAAEAGGDADLTKKTDEAAAQTAPQPLVEETDKEEKPGDGEPSGGLEPKEEAPNPAVREDAGRAPRRRVGGMPPPPPKSGDLVQARVQPSEMGSWANEIMNQVEYAFNTTKGTALGAMLFMAFSHWEEYVEFLESWLGAPEDAMRQMVWDVVQQHQQERLAESSVLEAEH